MSTRIRIGNAEPFATPSDFGSNPAAGRVFTAVAVPGGLDPQWTDAVVPLEAYYAANWAVTDWYLDGTTGSDSNDGTSAATPLKTGRELKRRLGQCAEWNHSVTIHVLANGMIDPLVINGLMLQTGIHVDVIGTETVIASDTIAAYLGRSQTNARATEITGTAIADFSPFVWKRLRVTSGARAGWTTWIAKANPNGVGLNVARCSQGGYIDPSYAVPVNPTAPSPGDAFVIERLPSVPYIRIDLSGPTSIIPITGAFPERQYMVRSVDCPQMYLSSIANRIEYRGLVFGCRLNAILPVGGGPQSYIMPEVTTSLFGVSPESGKVVYPQVPATSCLFGDGINAVFVYLTGVQWLTNSLFQGCRVQASADTQINASQIFDCTGSDAALTVYACDCYCFGISGDGNAIGLGLRNGSVLRYGSTFNLKGTIPARLLSTPTIDLTLAQAMQPNDYSQKGTAKLVAGSVTVTVPWYENTVQNVMVTPKTPGGTPGNWTVAQISTTQFTITSSNPLDTSTVNWFITPLGRGILVNAF
jgi:hypothetical protein